MEKEEDRDCVRMGGGGDDRASMASFLPSPSSSSSSDFEFRVSLSPSSKRSSAQLCPADELFYKGQLLPLHLSPRLSMVRTLLLASSSTSSDSTATASRDSNGSSSSDSSAADLLLLPDCDSSRPSSVTEEEARRIVYSSPKRPCGARYLSSFATRFSSVFLHRGSKRDPCAGSHIQSLSSCATTTTKKTNPPTSSSAKEVIKKYVKKVKPLYEKLSLLQQKHIQQQQHHNRKKTFPFWIRREREESGSCILPGPVSRKKEGDHDSCSAGNRMGIYSHSYSFSGNLRYPRRKRCAGSCPSSMRSSPSHSGLLCVGGGFPDPSASSSSMVELQSAIQGAIAHCKSSMIQANQSKASAPPVGDQTCGS